MSRHYYHQRGPESEGKLQERRAEKKSIERRRAGGGLAGDGFAEAAPDARAGGNSAGLAEAALREGGAVGTEDVTGAASADVAEGDSVVLLGAAHLVADGLPDGFAAEGSRAKDVTGAAAAAVEDALRGVYG